MDIQRLVEALKLPSLYPDNSKEIRIVETHISYIFFTGTYVYKVKKPVNFGFLDFTTIEKRKFFCRQEVRLNSRLSPDVYLGVEEIKEEDGRISLGGSGETIEYAVKMRELPAEGMLSKLVSEGQATPELMDKIAFKVALFHRETETSGEISEFGNISVIKKNSQENFIQTAPFLGRTIIKDQHDFISAKTRDFIENNKGTFVGRKSEGRIRDCHGDLHLGSICIEGECVQIFDCIEFNDRFRYSDTAADIAFLLMDLEFNNHIDLSTALTKSYIRYSGDTDLPLVLRFYKSYRAFVRGKVTSFLLDEAEVPEEQKTRAVGAAKKYFGLAYSYFMQPTLIIMAGLTGTGKTAVAAMIGEATGSQVVRSDVVRKKLAGIPLDEHKYEGYEKGIYATDFSEKTYAEAHKEASELLKTGRSVIIDASYKSRAERDRAASLARENGTRFFIIECVCDEETVKSRLTKRMEEKEVSDGRWEIYGRQKKEFEEITDNEGRFIRVDTARPKEESIEIILKVLGR
ncbi:MAG: AAA family ATPase [Deltaproteobacteria bacterium]|nr:AAA family ATPase [Deltaproteobacteria bacterium]